MPAPSHALLTALALLGVSCRTGAVAEIARPKPEVAAVALDTEHCSIIESFGEPLVVDWKPEKRGDLEAAMQHGIAVVSYDCHALKVLSDCKASGVYGFRGITRKEEIVRLESEDEVRANLPISGGVFGAEIGSQLARGTTLDIALVMVGKRRTTRRSASLAELKPKDACAGATHFVRGATVGAFVMQTGAHAASRSVAEIFSARAAATSGSRRNVRVQDGELGACKQASPDGPRPPGQCGALIRLELVAIGAPKSAKAPSLHETDVGVFGRAAGAVSAPVESYDDAVDPDDTIECPEGLYLTEGKCSPSIEKPHLCVHDEVDCTDQCAHGDGPSCRRLGAMYLLEDGVKRDLARALTFTKRGCDLGEAAACTTLGAMYQRGTAVRADVAAANALYRKSCDAGDGGGCARLGNAVLAGNGVPKDASRAATLFAIGCDRGNAAGCATLADLHFAGNGVPVDHAASARLAGRACDGGDAGGCGRLGAQTIAGDGVVRDRDAGIAFLNRGCERGSDDACRALKEIRGGK